MILILDKLYQDIPEVQMMLLKNQTEPRFRKLFGYKHTYLLAMVAFLNTCHQGVASDGVDETTKLTLNVAAEEKPLTALEIRRIKYKEFMQKAAEKERIEEEEREALEKEVIEDFKKLRENEVILWWDKDGPAYGIPASEKFEYSVIEEKIGQFTSHKMVTKRKTPENNEN